MLCSAQRPLHLSTHRFVLMNKMDDLNLHYRFLNWRRRIREIREVRAFRYQERFKHILVDGDTLRWVWGAFPIVLVSPFPGLRQGQACQGERGCLYSPHGGGHPSGLCVFLPASCRWALRVVVVLIYLLI